MKIEKNVDQIACQFCGTTYKPGLPCVRCELRQAAIDFLESYPRKPDDGPGYSLPERLELAESVLREVLVDNALRLAFGSRQKAAKILRVSNRTIAGAIERFPHLAIKHPLNARPKKKKVNAV